MSWSRSLRTVGMILSALLSLAVTSAAATEDSAPASSGRQDKPTSSRSTDDQSGPPKEVKDAFKALQGAANRVGDEIPKAVGAAASAVKKAVDGATEKTKSEEQTSSDGK